MKKTLIFGAGGTGRHIYDTVKNDTQVIGFLDNDAAKWGKDIEGVPILGGAEACRGLEYDEILIASLTGYRIMREQLVGAGADPAKISGEFVSTQVNARINFLRDFSALCGDKGDASLAVAEGGVFQGEFAKEINQCFPERKLYLFDTFEGFDARDVRTEHERNFSTENAGHLSITSVELVLGKLPRREQAVIRQGYFPETARGLEDVRFLFVNLDFDLYDPTLAGLRFFFPRLAEGGCLLVHDYYTPMYHGIKEAIGDFEKERGPLIKFPIGDHCSLGILKR